MVRAQHDVTDRKVFLICKWTIKGGRQRKPMWDHRAQNLEEQVGSCRVRNLFFPV